MWDFRSGFQIRLRSNDVLLADHGPTQEGMRTSLRKLATDLLHQCGIHCSGKQHQGVYNQDVKIIASRGHPLDAVICVRTGSVPGTPAAHADRDTDLQR